MQAMRKSAEEVVSRLRDTGHEAYFAGGCVRDHLRGEEPVDFDIVTDARPEQVQALFSKTVAVGAHFGVILVNLNGFEFEVATFRAEGPYTDHRHPDQVTFTTAKEDARRRDFTINGMFFDPLAGEVIDYVGGQTDLEARLVRAIGNPDDRFEEDHLRLMRAIRFATALEYEVEPATWSALRRHAPQIARISPERVRDELEKILVSPRRARGLDLLMDSGLMEAVIPEVLDLRGCEQPAEFHPEGDVYVHTRMMLEMLGGEASLTLVLSALLHDIGKPATAVFDEENQRIRFNGHDRVGAVMAEEILRRLKSSNEVIEAVTEAVGNHMAFMNVPVMRTAKLKRFMARTTFEEELELHRVDCLSSNGLLDNYEFLREKEKEFASEPLIPPPLITGHDLIQRGWRPGPMLGEALTAVQNLQLEGQLTTKEEALEWVEANLSRDKAEG